MGALIVSIFTYTTYGTVTCIFITLAFDMVVLFCFIMRALGLCILANQYLFDETEVLLLTWQEQATNWGAPESLFEPPSDKDTAVKLSEIEKQACLTWRHQDERKNAIAWTWDTEGKKPKKVSFNYELQETTTETSRQIYRTLESLRQRCQLLESKQKIMGLEVTGELRRRLLASAGSV